MNNLSWFYYNDSFHCDVTLVNTDEDARKLKFSTFCLHKQFVTNPQEFANIKDYYNSCSVERFAVVGKLTYKQSSKKYTIETQFYCVLKSFNWEDGCEYRLTPTNPIRKEFRFETLETSMVMLGCLDSYRLTLMHQVLHHAYLDLSKHLEVHFPRVLCHLIKSFLVSEFFDQSDDIKCYDDRYFGVDVILNPKKNVYEPALYRKNSPLESEFNFYEYELPGENVIQG